MGINPVIIDIDNSIMDIHHILKLEPSFLDKMQIPAGYIFPYYP